MLKKNIALIGILLIGLFFRTYNYQPLFEFGHEQDLQAWIVKDILVDHHFRLIGQETSISGVFIGPLYYYLLALFFGVANFNPLISTLLTALISLCTLISLYYVFSKLFNQQTGLIGSFIYAVSLPITLLDRWAVPTQPTLLWSVWFLYVIVSFSRGNFSSLPILIILTGLIWHIHIAFIPLLILVPLSLFLSKKPFVKTFSGVNKKYFITSLIATLLLIVPFVLFEIRHNYQQTMSLLSTVNEGEIISHGSYKEEVILKNIDRVLVSFLWEDQPLDIYLVPVVPISLIIFCLLIIYLTKIKQLAKKDTILVFSWIGSVLLVHSISQRPISEYYFNNLIILSLLIYSIIFAYLFKIKYVKNLLLAGLCIFLLRNSYLLLNTRGGDEYSNKLAAVRFISDHSRKNNYPCIGVNYIGDIGIRYGYRYLFWWNQVKQIAPGDFVPVYSLVIPYTISSKEVVQTFGMIGIIPPQNFKLDADICDEPTRQLQPLNGFNK